MNFSNFYQDNITNHIAVANDLLSEYKVLKNLEALVADIQTAFNNGGKFIIAGNGGSFSDAMHIAAEFVCRFKLERNALPAIALGTNMSSSTAISNDFSYNDIFLREFQAIANKDDVLLVISTSGNSENILRLTEYARNFGVKIYGMTGRKGGKLAEMCTTINIPSDDVPRIQEMHITLGHMVCDWVEQQLSK
jgi:D-sedoheptulose 7-phosphate isomerase